MLLYRVAEYIQSPAGQAVREKLWKETLDEMAHFTTLPALLKSGPLAHAATTTEDNDTHM